MCRWLAYSGSPVLLSDLLFAPENSLVVQSMHSRLGVEAVNGDGLKLLTIANRGVKVYPGGQPDTFTVDHWRCRFIADAGEGNAVEKSQVLSLLGRLNEAGLDVIKTENLYNFDGAKGYSA